MGAAAAAACLVMAALVVGDEPEPTDSCYRKDTNCYIPGDLEIGHTTYLPDIEVCENACRSLDGCRWFTWREGDDFAVYFLKDCPFPSTETRFTSGFIDECSEN